MRDYEYSSEQIREAAPRMTLEAIEEQKRQGILTHSEAKRLVAEHFCSANCRQVHILAHPGLPQMSYTKHVAECDFSEGA